eukprot:SAG22_NODE_13154_length_416_cov_1.949527_1_plen_41_part_10
MSFGRAAARTPVTTCVRAIVRAAAAPRTRRTAHARQLHGCL